MSYWALLHPHAADDGSGAEESNSIAYQVLFIVASIHQHWWGLRVSLHALPNLQLPKHWRLNVQHMNCGGNFQITVSFLLYLKNIQFSGPPIPVPPSEIATNYRKCKPYVQFWTANFNFTSHRQYGLIRHHHDNHISN